MQIKDFMTPCPYSIDGQTTIDEVLKKLALFQVRHLPVVEQGNLIGVLSERDLKLSKLVCDTSGFCPTAKQLCAQDPFIVADTDLLQNVARQMTQTKNDCALVVDAEGNFIGIFTTVDACRAIAIILEEVQQ